MKCKRLFSLALALVLCLGLFVPANAEKTETKYGKATELVTGVYSIVVPSVTPTDMASGAYYVSHETAVNPGFKFAAFDANHPDGAAVWKITKISDTQCTVQNESKGAQGYINLGAGTIGYGSEMKLNYEFVGGKCKFFATVGGQNWYIRFTNSSNESRFQSGTGTASHEFELYGNITEVIEDPAPEQVIPPVTGDPLLTIACISDLHTDYGLQNTHPYIRGSILTAVYEIEETEDADILLVGGDNTSDNGRTGGWKYDVFMNVIEEYRQLSYAASESGRSLWACGNHEYQVGVGEGYDSYAAYEDIMRETCGEPLSVLRQKDDKTLTDQQYPEFLLGIHYNIEGFDFIVMNAPYAQSQYYSTGTLNWLNERLSSIGKDKTVFLLTHYPLTDSRNISTPSYGVSGGTYTSVTNILKKFPNVIYLYGHNHGGDSVYIREDTFERITTYTKAGRVVNDRNAVPTSFISSFMGSMSYYNYPYHKDWLDAKDPDVIQALMIYVYGDRIVFQMKNYGEELSDVVPLSWTVMRDVQGSLTGSYVPSDGGENEKKDENLSAITKELLVTTDLQKDIIYKSSEGINKYYFQGTEEFKSYNNILVGSGIPKKAELTVKTLTSGEAYDKLANALEPVVTDFVAYSFALKNGSSEFTPEGYVKITTKIKADQFGPQTSELELAAYYLDKDGKLHLTDVQKNEDGSVSFLLPELTEFALSARAVVEDIAEGTAAGSPYEKSGIVLALVGGGIALVGLAVLAVVLIRIWKKEHPKKESEEK